MSNYDPVTVFSVSADSDGASNGIINATTNRSGVLIHKVILALTGTGLASSSVSVAINDHANIGSTATRLFLKTSANGTFAEDEYESYVSETYDPPARFDAGVSINFTGLASTTCFIHYTRS